MQDSQILSVFQELPSGPGGEAAPAQLVFDACHVGVVLRAVAFVEAVVIVGAMFGSAGFTEWLGRVALMTGAALPGALLWLIVGCVAKHPLQRLPSWMQWSAGIALGALAGLYGCMLLFLVGVLEAAPWLASASAGALLSAALVAGLVWRAKARTPAETAARLTELQQRIRPHFLFNTLNSAIALVRAEPAKAEAVLEDLSVLFRSALDDRGEPVTLAQEVALARSYLAIEQVRFGERLQVEWALDPQADGARLPPLLLQPLVENAVKHGVEPSASGAQVRISTQRRGTVVVIKVTNTVPSGQGERGFGLALANVRERLLLLHDVQAQFQAALKDGIYQVRMEIPV